MTREVMGESSNGFIIFYNSGSACHLQNFSSALMIWMVAPLVDEFGNMGFVENDIVMLLCSSNDPNNLHCLN
jgi:hypothetical protein